MGGAQERWLMVVVAYWATVRISIEELLAET